MTGKNILKEQLRTGTIDMPSVTGALKDSGAVTLDLSSIEERPKETIVSMSDEAETGQKMDGNAEKGTCHSRDEPRKSHLPHDDLEQDLRVITGKKVPKQQKKTGKVNTPSVSGALKKSGEARIVVASVHEPPKKSRGPSTTEKQFGGMKVGNDDKVTCDTGKEPEKSLPPQDDLSQKVPGMTQIKVLKQQLQTSNVNMSSVSGALKKSGEVRIVVASVHEPPKKTRGSSTKEIEGCGMKEESDDKVTSNKGEEPEMSLLPQDDFQGKMQVMTGETVPKQQPHTGNVNKPAVSGALKKEKVVSFDLASIEVHPKETSGPLIKETEV